MPAGTDDIDLSKELGETTRKLVISLSLPGIPREEFQALAKSLLVDVSTLYTAELDVTEQATDE